MIRVSQRYTVAIQISLIILLLALSTIVRAQGFMVAPMRLDLDCRPGERLEKTVKLRNTLSSSITLLTMVTELGQAEYANWIPLDPQKDKDDIAKRRSCAGWITLKTAEAPLTAMGTSELPVSIQVPYNVHGTYSACLIIRTPAPKVDPNSIALVIQFAIPVIINISGLPAKENVGLTDARMRFIEATDASSANTQVVVTLGNAGETYAQMTGKVILQAKVGDRWRIISTTPLRDTNTIPGSMVRIVGDLKRRLPSGAYKIMLDWTVNGRKKAPFANEVEFQGDPAIKNIAADVTLQITPESLVVKGVPGSHRTMILTIKNESDETLQIDNRLVIPQELKNLVMGEMKGEDLDCTPLTDLAPVSFTLQGFQRQNIRVSVNYPADMRYPEYFGTWLIHARYPDGQSAGDTSVDLTVLNTKAPPTLGAQAIQANIALLVEEQNIYLVTTEFVNTGTMHFKPTATVALTTATGDRVIGGAMETAVTRVLPLGTVKCAGTLDFSKVAPGEYVIESKMSYGARTTVDIALPVHVVEQVGQKVVTVVEKLPADTTTGQEKADGKQ